MHIELSEQFKNTHHGDIASEVIAKCVHCGFCNATCPTYQLLGDELDGPRGRIYQIKQIFEGTPANKEIALHLDRCLTCRNCETTCPSGVEYHKLLDVGREVVEQHIPRGVLERAQRWLLIRFLSRRVLVTPVMKLIQPFRGLMPVRVKQNVPVKQHSGHWPGSNHTRKMLILQGCVQPGMKPLTNAAAARVLDRLGISLIEAEKESCCGALSFHLNEQNLAKQSIRNNIDAWWPHIEAGIEAIISTASGCGVMIKDYAHVMRSDPSYADKAKTISQLTRDLSEIIVREDLQGIKVSNPVRVAFHPPCTLQHGQQLNGVVESILKQCGYELTPFANAHLCCGSAGTYSIFQKKISRRLLQQKITAIMRARPDVITTANIGCQLHLESATDTKVLHWIELLDR